MFSGVLTRTRALVRAYRWRWLDPVHNVEAIHIPALISPLRYDVVAIRDFVAFYAAHPGLETDFSRLLEHARRTRYYEWMQAMYQQRFAARHPQGYFEEGFVRFVRRTVDLWASIQAGFDRSCPIEVRITGRLLPTATGKRVALRYILGDGSHRLACLMVQGLTELPPDFYRIRWYRRYRPYDSTWFLTGRGLLPEAEYFAFLSEIYGAPPDCRDRISFMLFVKRALPEREAEVRAILHGDGFPV